MKRTRVQTILFSRPDYTISRARKWLRAHGFRHGKFHMTEHYIRARQLPPSRFQRKTFRTIQVNPMRKRKWLVVYKRSRKLINRFSTKAQAIRFAKFFAACSKKKLCVIKTER